jgi:diaminopropionate ammonia-lyase
LSARVFDNPLRAPDGVALAGVTRQELDAVAAFAPHLPATPLHDAGVLASALGLAGLLIKDETRRWGLNAFKITGVSYALGAWQGSAAARLISCASAGNHGRAVARAARDRGLPCRVFLPSDALPSRVEAIRAEGAEVVQVAGSYEEAVEQAARDARETGALLVSDTVPPGDPEIPGLILRGYTRVFTEAEAVWDFPPDLVVVQAGVGGLAGAAALWTRAALPEATLLVVEPEGSACLMASAAAGRRVMLPATSPTSMVCLRCATPSAAAWPLIAARADGFVTVSDDETEAARALLAVVGIASGASGACGLAGLAAIASDFRGRRALVIATEGP